MRTDYKTETGLSGLFCVNGHEEFKRGGLKALAHHVGACGPTCGEAAKVLSFEFYEYKATGTDTTGKRFTVHGPQAVHVNVFRGALWERLNGGKWRKVKIYYN